jgi:uncharacterized membrane protein YsdA (DUF1294 family)
MNIPTIFAIAATVWNIITFLLYGADKHKSRKKERRISEKTLILCAFLMGGVGALFGMTFFRHKTKHWKFKRLIPLALAVNIGMVVLIFHFYEIIFLVEWWQ